MRVIIIFSYHLSVTKNLETAVDLIENIRLFR